MEFLNKLAKFMYGRYGTDNLNHFFLLLYVLCFMLNLFLKQSWIFLIELILVFVIFYRTFSKKFYQRRKENQLYLKLKNIVCQPFETMIKNQKDKSHIYKKCHKCKTILRLPLPTKRGIRHAKCPNCKKKLTIFAFKYQKIEIIKNK